LAPPPVRTPRECTAGVALGADARTRPGRLPWRRRSALAECAHAVQPPSAECCAAAALSGARRTRRARRALPSGPLAGGRGLRCATRRCSMAPCPNGGAPGAGDAGAQAVPTPRARGALARGGHTLATGKQDRRILLTDLRAPTPAARLAGHKAEVCSLEAHPHPPRLRPHGMHRARPVCNAKSARQDCV